VYSTVLSRGDCREHTRGIPCSLQLTQMEINYLFGVIRRCHGDNRVLNMRAAQNEMLAL
jgi:hypothetical protein